MISAARKQALGDDPRIIKPPPAATVTLSDLTDIAASLTCTDKALLTNAELRTRLVERLNIGELQREGVTMVQGLLGAADVAAAALSLTPGDCNTMP